MSRSIQSRPSERVVQWRTLLLLPLLLAVSHGQRPHGRDFVFPPVIDLAIGDRCTVPPSPSSDVPYARDGICQRVRDCSTFVPRVILESFDIRRDVCYFEVHDPVVCCVQEPVPASKLQEKILNGRLVRPTERSAEQKPISTNWIRDV